MIYKFISIITILILLSTISTILAQDIIIRTTTVTEDEFIEGLTKMMVVGERLRFRVDATFHLMEIKEITNTEVTINVSPDQTTTLPIGKATTFDVDEDDYFDVLIRLNDISNNKAKITLKSFIGRLVEIEQEEPDQPINENNLQEVSNHQDSTDNTILGLLDNKILIFIILIIIILIIYSFRKRS